MRYRDYTSTTQFLYTSYLTLLYRDLEFPTVALHVQLPFSYLYSNVGSEQWAEREWRQGNIAVAPVYGELDIWIYYLSFERLSSVKVIFRN